MNIFYKLSNASVIVFTALLLSYSAASYSEQYWHGDANGVEWFPTGKNLTYNKSDPRVHPLLTEYSRKMDQGVFKIGDNVYQAYGYALTSPTFIVGPTGVLIVDPPEDVKKAKQTLAAFRKYSDKPIAGVMYSHWHPDHYGGGFVVM